MLTEIKFNKRFTGKLRSGITTSSSLDDVLAAYGYPINEIETDSLIEDPHDYANRTLYTKDHRAKIWYRDLGLVFYFEENTVRVFWIIRI